MPGRMHLRVTAITHVAVNTAAAADAAVPVLTSRVLLLLCLGIVFLCLIVAVEFKFHEHEAVFAFTRHWKR